MTLQDDIAVLEEKLDPAMRAVFALLRKTNEDLTESNKALTEEVAKLTAQVAKFQKMLFGSKSEKLPPIQSEVRRAVEAEELFAQSSQTAVDEEEALKQRRKRGRAASEPNRKKNRQLRKNLPVIREKVLVRAEDIPEGYTLDDFREIGKDGEANAIQRIEHVREHLVIVEYVLQTLASRDNEHIIIAAAPPSVVEGGHYGPSVYAHDVVSRCEFSLPHNRLGKMLGFAGYKISRSTLTSLYHRSAELLKPIYDRLFEITRNDPYVSADETGISIQHKGRCKKGWLWMMLSASAIVYYFSESRGGKVSQKLLGKTIGYLQVDGYSGYNDVCEDKSGGRIRIGCWTHARRLFFEALSELSENRKVLEWILELYRIEYKAAELGFLGTMEHLALRQNFAVPVMDKIYEWITKKKKVMPPQGNTGKAITYTLNQWEYLCTYLTDPTIRLDNNLSENALRIIALGRKNFLFVGHEEAGQNLAILQTITSTCRLHNVDPYEYIKDVLIRVQTHPASRIDDLLPHNWAQTLADSE